LAGATVFTESSYEIDERTETVWILHIRHGALQDLDTAELAALPQL
jgi:hypothetical protein